MEEFVYTPIMCQGMKSKLIPFIKETVNPNPEGYWIEPFMGTGIVGFNVNHPRIKFSDKNPHIINLYTGIQNGTITSQIVKEFLEYHLSELEKYDYEYYKEARSTFNKTGDPLYFIFLNRTCFNGLIRFNSKGEFNSSYCKNPERLRRAIGHIANTVAVLSEHMRGKEWSFRCCDWKESFDTASEIDYIYLDPPYIGRDTTYFSKWDTTNAVELSEYAHRTPANVCLSLWKDDKDKKNDHLFEYWSDFTWHEINHKYSLGGQEHIGIIEVLAIKR